MDDGGGARKKVLSRRNNNTSTNNNSNYKSSKDRDEDLHLFREMYKREKDRVASLLQPVSDEFEVNCEKLTVIYGGGGFMPVPGKKGPVFDIFAAESGKNDYDWLKTPPATPLFPSLEMETNLPDLIVQREIPIIHPLTRFVGKSQEIGKSKVLPRYSTPNRKPRSVSTHINNNFNKSNSSSTGKEERHVNLLAANMSKSMGSTSSSSSSSMDTNNMIKPTKPKMRAMSPSSIVRYSRIPADQIPVLSLHDQTQTNRSVSASRQHTTTTNVANSRKKQDQIDRRTRQSCSPSVTRGRKEDNEKFQQGNNNSSSRRGTQVLGSRMVDRFLNARNIMSNCEEKNSNKLQIMNSSMNESSTKIADVDDDEGDAGRTRIEERHNRTKFMSSSISNEGSGAGYYGRFMPRSSLDKALTKQLDFQKDLGVSSKRGTNISRRSSSVSKRNPMS